MLLALVATDAAAYVPTVSCGSGSRASDVDRGGLERDLDGFLERYAHLPLEQLHLGPLLVELMGVVRAHRLRLPERSRTPPEDRDDVRGRRRAARSDISARPAARAVRHDPRERSGGLNCDDMCLVAGCAREVLCALCMYCRDEVLAILSPAARASPHRRQVGAATATTALWTAGTDGGVFTLRGGFFGSLGSKPLNAPVISMAGTPTGRGYWLAALDGGVFTFGDAVFHGSMGGKHLNAPVVGMAATPTGKGLLARRDRRRRLHLRRRALLREHGRQAAQPAGRRDHARRRRARATGSSRATAACSRSATRASPASLAGKHLNAPMSTIAATPSGKGYWLLGRDGGVFTFGDAVFHGAASVARRRKTASCRR